MIENRQIEKGHSMLGLIPKLDGDRPLRVLCLGAHSDDIEIGCGGTLMQLADTYPLEVCWTVFSGSRSRVEEAEHSAEHWLKTVEGHSVEFHEFKDGFFPDQKADIKLAFEQIKAGFEPDIIFSHYCKDFHQDHQVVNELTWNTFRNHCILEYEIPQSM